MLKASIRDNNPVMFVESQLLYGLKGKVPEGYSSAAGRQEAVVGRGGDIMDGMDDMDDMDSCLVHFVHSVHVVHAVHPESRDSL